MRVPRKLGTVAFAAATALALTSCSYATPDTASIGLSYTGGSWESKAWNTCVQPGANQAVDTGGDVYYYPVGTRTWTFANTPGADAPPILVSTANNQELIVSGTITFLFDSDCTKKYTDKTGREWPGGKPQLFHDTIGRSKGAFFGEDSTIIPQGWRDVLGIFLGGPANRALDQAGGAYKWQTLYSDTAEAAKFTEAAKRAIPLLLEAQTGGESYFKIIDIQLDKPTVPQKLKDELEEQERAIIAQSTADQQKRFAEGWPGGLSGYAAYQRQVAETKCLESGRCTMLPYGASVPVR